MGKKKFKKEGFSVMAQTPLDKRLQVVYTIYDSNGKAKTGQLSLYELLAKGIGFTKQISKLAFLPLFNADGTLSTQSDSSKVVDRIPDEIPVKFYENFPELTHLGYPSQFINIDIDNIQKYCPNLSHIDRIVPVGYYSDSKKPQDIKIEMKEITMKEQPTGDPVVDGYAFGHIESVESYSIITVNPKKVSNRQPRPVAVTNNDIKVAVTNLHTEISNNQNLVVAKIDNFEQNILNVLNQVVGRISQDQLDSIITTIKQTITLPSNIIDSEERLTKVVSDCLNNKFEEFLQTYENKENANYKKLLEELTVIRENTTTDAEAIALIRQRIDEELPNLFINSEKFQNFVFARLGSVDNSLLNITEDNESFQSFVKLCGEELQKIHNLIGTLSTSDEVKSTIKEAFASLAHDLQSGQSKMFTEIKDDIAKLPTVDTMREMVVDGVTTAVEEVNFHTDLVAEHIISDIIGSGVHLSDTDKQDILKILSAVQDLATSEQADGIILSLNKETVLNNARFVHVKDQLQSMSGKINSEALLGTERHKQLIDKLAELKIDDEKITEIVDSAVGKTSIATQAIVGRIVNTAVDKIIESNGNLAQLNRLDEEQIKKIVQGFTSSPEFKSFLNEIIDSKQFATAEGLKELDRLINGGIDITISTIDETKSLIVDKFDSLIKKLETDLDGIAKKEDLDRMISRSEDGEIKGLIPESVRQIVQEELVKAGLVSKSDLSSFEQTMSTQINNIMTQLGPVFALIQENGGIVNNVTNNSYTVSDDSNSTPTVNVQTNVTVEQMNEMIQNAVRSLISIYVINNAMSNNQLQGLGLGGVVNVQQNYGQVLGLLASALAGNNISLQPQVAIDNNQINNILQLLIKNMGVPQQPTINPEVAKLQAEMDALKKKHEADMDALKKQLGEIVGLLKKDPAPAKTGEVKDDPKTPDPKTGVPTKKDPDPKLDPKTPEPKVKPAEPIKEPTPVGKQKLVAGTIEHLNRVKEPKRPFLKRVGKWIVRHPILAGVIGAGVALTGLAGAGVISMAIKSGGLALGLEALKMKIPFYIPTIIKTGAIGAAVPLAGGVVGGIVSRFSKKSKKERLYTKFLRQKAKCDALAQSIEEKVIAQELAEQKIQEARDKQRHGSKILKKLGVYKFARNFNRKKMRRLRAEVREIEARREATVAQALSTKKSLNAMEDADHVTLAMGGHLQRLRQQKSKLEAQLATPNLDEEERQDIQEDIQTVIEDAEDEVAGISTLTDSYKTFDTEAEELITSVKSESLRKQLAEIRARNSRRTVHTIDVPEYDPKQVEEYIARARASNNPQEQAKAERIAAYMEDIKNNRTTLKELIDSRKISQRLANQLMTKDSVEIAPSEVIDIEFKELVEESKPTEESTDEKTK